MQHSLRKNALETTVRKYFQRCFGEVLAKTGRGHQVVVGNKAGFCVVNACEDHIPIITLFSVQLDRT